MCCRSLTGRALFASGMSVLPNHASMSAGEWPLMMVASAKTSSHRYHNVKVVIERPFHLLTILECLASLRPDSVTLPHLLYTR
jgi:hypothetical protein